MVGSQISNCPLPVGCMGKNEPFHWIWHLSRYWRSRRPSRPEDTEPAPNSHYPAPQSPQTGATFVVWGGKYGFRLVHTNVLVFFKTVPKRAAMRPCGCGSLCYTFNAWDSFWNKDSLPKLSGRRSGVYLHGFISCHKVGRTQILRSSTVT